MHTCNAPRLDARLAAAYDFVRPGHAAADIGCDHGKLSAALAGSGRCPLVLACDLRPGPLEKARVTCAPYGDKVQCRLGSGLSVLEPGEVDDIIIAGMGAETIIEIPEGEHLFYAESGFATSVDGFLNNSRVYTADNAGKRYLYENGKKRELGPNDPGDFQAKGARTEPTYGAWTSASGTRKVTYTRDGSLTLHDGTSFYPLAFKKESDRLVWIIASSAGVEKCTYKL